jgi:hypothetical protein
VWEAPGCQENWEEQKQEMGREHVDCAQHQMVLGQIDVCQWGLHQSAVRLQL